MHAALFDKCSTKSPDSGSAALEYELAEQRDQVRRGEARGGEEKIQSNSAGVTFSHNPPQMLLVSGDRAAEGRWEERWEAFRIILRRGELKVVTFGRGGTSFFVFFPPPLCR